MVLINMQPPLAAIMCSWLKKNTLVKNGKTPRNFETHSQSMDQDNIQASSDSMWALKVVYLKVTLHFILFFKIDKNF